MSQSGRCGGKQNLSNDLGYVFVLGGTVCFVSPPACFVSYNNTRGVLWSQAWLSQHYHIGLKFLNTFLLVSVLISLLTRNKCSGTGTDPRTPLALVFSLALCPLPLSRAEASSTPGTLYRHVCDPPILWWRKIDWQVRLGTPSPRWGVAGVSSWTFSVWYTSPQPG